MLAIQNPDSAPTQTETQTDTESPLQVSARHVSLAQQPRFPTRLDSTRLNPESPTLTDPMPERSTAVPISMAELMNAKAAVTEDEDDSEYQKRFAVLETGGAVSKAVVIGVVSSIDDVSSSDSQPYVRLQIDDGSLSGTGLAYIGQYADEASPTEALSLEAGDRVCLMGKLDSFETDDGDTVPHLSVNNMNTNVTASERLTWLNDVLMSYKRRQDRLADPDSGDGNFAQFDSQPGAFDPTLLENVGYDLSAEGQQQYATAMGRIGDTIIDILADGDADSEADAGRGINIEVQA